MAFSRGSFTSRGVAPLCECACVSKEAAAAIEGTRAGQTQDFRGRELEGANKRCVFFGLVSRPSIRPAKHSDTLELFSALQLKLAVFACALTSGLNGGRRSTNLEKRHITPRILWAISSSSMIGFFQQMMGGKTGIAFNP